MSYLKVPITARRLTVVALGPMEILFIDFMGPFPPDEYGNTMVWPSLIRSLMLLNYTYAVTEVTAKETAWMLIR